MPRLRKRLTWCAVIVVWLLESTPVWACGQERWPVKVGTDRDVQQITLSPTQTTIALLSQIPCDAQKPDLPVFPHDQLTD